MQRVDEGTDPDAADAARAAGGNIAKQLTNDSLRQILGFNLAAQGEFSEFGGQSPVSADDAFQKS